MDHRWGKPRHGNQTQDRQRPLAYSNRQSRTSPAQKLPSGAHCASDRQHAPYRPKERQPSIRDHKGDVNRYTQAKNTSPGTLPKQTFFGKQQIPQAHSRSEKKKRRSQEISQRPELHASGLLRRSANSEVRFFPMLIL